MAKKAFLRAVQHNLETAVWELRQLRQRNAVLEAKVSVLDTFDLALRADGGPQGHAFREDPIVLLTEQIEFLARRIERKGGGATE